MRRALGLLVLAASLAFLGVAIAKTYHRLPGGTLHVRPAYFTLAVLAVAAANSSAAVLWAFLLRSHRVRLGLPSAVRIISLSQLGKYLPGGFWQPLGWIGLARGAGVAGGVASVTIAMTMALVVAAALIVGPILLASSGSAGAFVWLLLVVPVVLAALHPRVLSRALSLAARVTRRPGLDTGGAPFRDVMTGLALAAPQWFAHGTSVALTALALGLGGWADWTLLTGSFAVAWAVGFLALPVPGGLGIREGVLLVLLRNAFGVPEALAIAVGSRLVFIVAEALMAGVALLIPRARAASVP